MASDNRTTGQRRDPDMWVLLACITALAAFFVIEMYWSTPL